MRSGKTPATQGKSRIRSGLLRSVFRSDVLDRNYILVAQLCVLYEDLRIEISALTCPSIPLLDVLYPATTDGFEPTPGKYRMQYFLRRSIATLREFADALRKLDQEDSFAQIKTGFTENHLVRWNAAIAFFAQQESHINKIRNDVGGHFGEPATREAIKNLPETETGRIEMESNAEGQVDAKLYFAGDIVASAMFRHLGADKWQGFSDLVEIAKDGSRHAITCVEILIRALLWSRFGHSS